jgi:hypothetical protein
MAEFFVSRHQSSGNTLVLPDRVSYEDGA